MASCARKMRSSSNSGSNMTSPKGSFSGCPGELGGSPAAMRRKKTRHDHGPVPLLRRHSIGHLHEAESACATIDNKQMVKHVYLVHASPGAFKSGMPETAWIKDDFPELCEPITAMRGRSTSMSSLLGCQPDGSVGNVVGWRTPTQCREGC
jgi:hypothetical protein